MQMWVQSLGREDPLEKEMQPTPVFLPGKYHRQKSLVGYIVRGVAKSQKQLSNLTSKPELLQYYRNYYMRLSYGNIFVKKIRETFKSKMSLLLKKKK